MVATTNPFLGVHRGGLPRRATPVATTRERERRGPPVLLFDVVDPELGKPLELSRHDGNGGSYDGDGDGTDDNE
jgi:hypothetical protein